MTIQSAITAALLAATLGGTPATAQTEETGPPADPAAVEATEPAAEQTTSVADIVAEVDEAETRLREIRSDIEPEEQIEEIAEELDEFTLSLRTLETDLDDRTLAGMSIDGLTDLRARWTRERDRLAGWDITIQNRSKSLADQRVELQRLIESLETAEASQQTDLPAPLVDRLASANINTAEIQQLIDLRLTAVLTLRNHVNELKTRCSDAVEQIEQSQRQARQRVFSRDQPPLWKAFERREQPGEAPGESWSKKAETLVSFAGQNREQLAFQLALFVLLALLITYLRRRSGITKQAEEDESLKAAALVLSRPLSAALLLTLFCTRYVSPDAPTVVLELNRLLFIFPLLRFVPPLLPAAMRSPLYGLFAVYVIQHLGELAPETSLFLRLTLLVTTGIALAGDVWVIKRVSGSSNTEGPQGRGGWRRAGLFALRIGGLVLIASLIANTVGRVRLAALLTEAVLITAYAIVTMYAIIRLLDSMTTVLLRTPALLALNVVRGHSELLKQRTSKVVRFVAVVMVAVVTLQILELRVPVLDALRSALDRQWNFGAFGVSLGDALTFVVSIWIAVQIARFVRFALDEDVLPRLGLARGVPQTVSMLVYYAVLAAGSLVALAAAGIELSRLTLVIGALSVGIGFGLQNLVNNFVSGLILIFERPIKIGDVVEVGTIVGTVRRIGIRSSVVRTFSGSDVIVPNGSLISQEVVNWTFTDRLRRIEIPVGVAYDSNPVEALRILTETAQSHDEILTNPEPYALAHGFGNDALDLELRFWTASEGWLQIKTEVIVAVHQALGQAGIEIAYPQLDLHLRSDDTGRSERTVEPGEEPSGAAP